MIYLCKKDCKDRKVGCQATCELLQRQNEHNRKEKAALKKQTSRIKDDVFRTRVIIEPMIKVVPTRRKHSD